MSDEMGPWDFIGFFVVGAFVGRMLRKHWRFIVVAIIGFRIYRHFFMKV